MFLQLFLCVALSSTIRAATMDPIDLTYDLDASMPLFINTSYMMNVITNPFSPVQTENITMTTAVGTHVQAPCRYSSGKKCVSNLTIDRLKGHLVIMDFIGQNADTPISAQQVNDWQKNNGAIQKKSIVIINTGWGDNWSNSSKYFNATGALNNTNMHFPGLGKDAADALIKLDISAIGIDTASLDYGQSNGSFVVHKAFADADIYAILNVANIKSVTWRSVKNTTGYVMPMKVKGAGAAPCRLFVVTSGVGEALSKSTVSLFIALCSALFLHVR